MKNSYKNPWFILLCAVLVPQNGRVSNSHIYNSVQFSMLISIMALKIEENVNNILKMARNLKKDYFWAFICLIYAPKSFWIFIQMSYSDSAQKTASSGKLDIILINNFLSFEKFIWGVPHGKSWKIKLLKTSSNAHGWI